MHSILENITSIVVTGVSILVGVMILRFVLKFAWRFIRAALIVLSLVMLAGYFLGVFDFVLR